MQHRIGIDFGTSFCTASWINPATNRPEAILLNQSDRQKMPSIVYCSPSGELSVGWTAFNIIENSGYLPLEERNEVMSGMIIGIKRMMQPNQTLFLPGGRTMTQEEVISEIFKMIKLEVEEVCFDRVPVQEVVITHPVVFESYKKEMLRDAAHKAGFTAIELVMEPVAAAMGYMSARERKKQGILVYDFGGGTFDVAFIQFDETGDYKIPVPPMGDPQCGGNDLDRLLYMRWERLAKAKHNRSISPDHRLIDKVFEMSVCTKQKELMSRQEKHKYSTILPPPDLKRLDMELDRNEWNAMITPVVDKTIDLTHAMIDKVTNLGYRIDRAVMIGGSSRIPLVYDRLKEILPVEPQRVMEVDVAVALGAATYFPKEEVMAKEMYCIYCGAKISTAHKFCWKNGERNEYYDKRFDK